MTKKLFYEDSFRQEFDAVVTECKEQEGTYLIVLDQTVFFPEGGGQSADTGMLWCTSGQNDQKTITESMCSREEETVHITDVQEKNGQIYHKGDRPLEVGSNVHGKIDWTERFSKMQQHTGEHIVSGLVNSIYGYHNVGFHLAKDYVTLDFDGALTKKQLREVEQKANGAIAENIPVEVAYPSHEELKTIAYRSKIEIEGQVRIVTIPGYDICACCAPHVKQTGQIGMIKFVGMQNYKGGVRITMQCGFRALEDYNRKEALVQKISTSLSVKEDEAADAVERLKEEIYRLTNEKAALMSQILSYKAENQNPVGRVLIVLEEELDGVQMREYVNLLMEKEVDTCILVNGDGEAECHEFKYVAASKTEDARKIAKWLNDRCHGRGGGKPDMVQGALQTERQEIEQLIREIKAQVED